MSQCDRILGVLQDGREHEMRDIHRAIGFCRLNSRVAELRGRGHNIVCRKTKGEYWYRLLLPAGVSEGEPNGVERPLHTAAPSQAPEGASSAVQVSGVQPEVGATALAGSLSLTSATSDPGSLPKSPQNMGLSPRQPSLFEETQAAA